MKPWPSSTNRPPTIRHLRVGVGRSTRQALPDHELQPAPRAGSGKLASSDATLRVRASSSFGRFRGISTNGQPGPGVATIPPVHSPGGCRMSGRALHHDIRGRGPRPPTPIPASPGANGAIPRHEPTTGRVAGHDRRPCAVASAESPEPGCAARSGSRRRSNPSPTRAREPSLSRRLRSREELSARAIWTAWRSKWRSL